jgi:hypothetical protein
MGTMPDTEDRPNDLDDAAAAAGLSREKLREAMEVQTLPARVEPTSQSLVGPPERGLTAAHVENRISLPPQDALGSVRGAIQKHTALRGHMQGDAEADIVDERSGLTYRIRSQDDGENGALVRVDIDPSDAKGGQTLLTSGVAGISLTMVLLGWWLSTTLLLIGVGVGALGGLLIWRRGKRLQTAIHDARAIASAALSEAEQTAPIGGALPPEGGSS